MTQTKRTARPPAAPGDRAASPFRAAEIKPHSGVPTLHLTNRPVPPLLVDVLPSTPSVEIAACAAAGISLYRLVHVGLGWTGKGESDHRELDSRVAALLAADPKANFLLEIAVDAPEWWLEANPAECVAYCRPAEEGEKVPALASWASGKWLRETGEALTHLLRHVEKETWSSRCIGVHLAAGAAGEWRIPQAERLPDTGPRMTERFREFALSKYRRNTGLLRKAWFDTNAEFAAIRCPNAHDRKRADMGFLRNPSRSRRLLDYYEACFQAQNESALHFCTLAKRATHGRMLVGLSYAHAFAQAGLAEAGHLFPEPVLDSPDVDFFANAGDEEVEGVLPALTGSLALRGKFLFHIVRQTGEVEKAAALARTHHAGSIVPTSTPSSVLKNLWEEANQGLKLPAKARKSEKELAIVVDLSGALATSCGVAGENWLNESLVSGQIQEFARLEIPFDTYLLSDLFHPRFPEAKVVVFLNSFYLSEAERRQVDARVKRSGKTGVWFWGAGVIGEDSITAALGQQVCGQKLRLEPGATSLRVRVVANEPYTWGKPVGATFGLDKPVAPTITIADKTALRLGANTANKTVFAVRRFDTWTSLVFGTTPVPARLLRNALREAGLEMEEPNPQPLP